MSVSINLTSLPQWDSLQSNIYKVSIKAKSPIYATSLMSNKVDVIKINPILNNNSWELISAVSEAGLAENYWSIGDTKDIVVQGVIGSKEINEILKVFIIDFNHNASQEGSGISFGTFINNGIQSSLVDKDYAINTSDLTSFTVNTTNSNLGGWKSSHIRYQILGSTDTDQEDASAQTAINPVPNTFMSCLPTELRAVMKPIKKYTDNIGGAQNIAEQVTATIDYLPLMSEFEIFGRTKYANSFEQDYQTAYTYYISASDRINYNNSNLTNAVGWRCRSVCSTTAKTYCAVASSGVSTHSQANRSIGINPVFLI